MPNFRWNDWNIEHVGRHGVTMREALKAFGCDPEAVTTLRGRNVAAFVLGEGADGVPSHQKPPL